MAANMKKLPTSNKEHLKKVAQTVKNNGGKVNK